LELVLLVNNQFLTRKSSGGHQAKRRKEEKNLSPRDRKACHSISTALTSALSHACKTPPVEGAGAGYLPVPYPGGAKKKKKVALL
jgi:hypothetical protein